MSDLTRAIMRYKETGYGFEEIKTRLYLIIYDYPKMFRGFEPDTCGDFLMYMIPKVEPIIERYQRECVAFEGYFKVCLRWRLKSFLRAEMTKRTRSAREVDAYIWQDINRAAYATEPDIEYGPDSAYSPPSRYGGDSAWASPSDRTRPSGDVPPSDHTRPPGDVPPSDHPLPSGDVPTAEHRRASGHLTAPEYDSASGYGGTSSYGRTSGYGGTSSYGRTSGYGRISGYGPASALGSAIDRSGAAWSGEIGRRLQEFNAANKGLLFFCLKAICDVDDIRLPSVARLCGVSTEWLVEVRTMLTGKTEKRRNRLARLRRRQETLYSRLRDAEEHLVAEPDLERRSALRARIDRLSFAYRRASHEACHTNLRPSNTDIADMLHVPKGTVDSGIARAREVLTSSLKETAASAESTDTDSMIAGNNERPV